jgi:lipase chaperone LimK
VLYEKLPAGAAAEAALLLDRYLEYRERAAALVASGELSGDLGERLSGLRALRREVLGERDAAALFGDEEAEDAAALAERSLALAGDLTPEERERRRASLEAQLPERLKATREEATAPLRLARDEAALREAGGTDADVRVLREGYFGAEAADRLSALDAQRREWTRRVEEFRAARQAIEADAALSASARAEAVAALLEKSFTPTEQLRVRALEGI